MNLRTRISLACLVAMSGSALAADGDPDPTFSSDGLARVTWPYPTSRVRVAAAADGSIFHATTEAIDNGAETDLDFAVSKFRSNGQLDSTFGTQGQLSVGFDVIPDGDDGLLGVFPLASGRLLLAGTVDLDPESSTYAAPGLLRLTASGDIDASFGENGRVVVPETPWVPNDDVDLNTVLRQPDGKLVFAGHCYSCGGISLVIAVRLTESGEIDPSFGDTGWVGIEVPSSVQAYAAAIDASGRIVIAGAMEPEDDFHDRPWLARLTPDGSLDSGFGNGTGMSFLSQVPHFNNDWFVRAIAIDRDGSIVLALGNGAGAIVRVDADGSLDTTFANGGFRSMEREDGTDMRAVAIRSDHRIMVAGTINHTGGGYDHLIGRLLRDGTLDPDFDGNGVIRIDMVEGETDSGRDIVLSAGRPVIAGYGGADLDVSTLVRLQSDLIFADGCGD